MNSTLPPHPGEEILLRHLDDDLSPTDAHLLERHLGACDACRAKLEEVRETLNEYLQFHEMVLKKTLPPPPLEWVRLDFRSASRRVVPQRKPGLLALMSPRWIAAAAVLAAVFFAVRRFERVPEVKAAELLHKAVTAEQTIPARPRSIRLRTRARTWNRPAGQPPAPAPDSAEIRQLFESAGYRWEDPLSAGAFAGWHDRLPAKQDQVLTVSRQGVAESYVIHTTTVANPITDASLTLRAADLRAVACTLRFGSAEIVEMTEMADEEPAPRSTVPPAQPAAAPQSLAIPPKQAAGPGDELRVMAALHRIGADLGEPIEVRREGPNVLVNVTGVDVRRQEELRSALSAIPLARLRFGNFARRESGEMERRPAPQVDTANPLLAELQAVSPDAIPSTELGDRLTENSEHLIEHLYALRALARRFPAAIATELTSADAATLRGIILDHAAAIASSTAAIKRLLAPILPGAAAAGQVRGGAWQDIAEALLADARSLDQALYVTRDNPDARKLRAAQALADIDERLAELGATAPQ